MDEWIYPEGEAKTFKCFSILWIEPLSDTWVKPEGSMETTARDQQDKLQLRKRKEGEQALIWGEVGYGTNEGFLQYVKENEPTKAIFRACSWKAAEEPDGQLKWEEPHIQNEQIQAKDMEKEMTQVLSDKITEYGSEYEYKSNKGGPYVFIPIHFGLKTPDTAVDNETHWQYELIKEEQDNTQSTQESRSQVDKIWTTENIMEEIKEIFRIRGETVKLKHEEIWSIFMEMWNEDHPIYITAAVISRLSVRSKDIGGTYEDFIKIIKKDEEWGKHVRKVTQREGKKCNKYWNTPDKNDFGVILGSESIRRLMNLRSFTHTEIKKIRRHAPGLQIYLECKYGTWEKKGGTKTRKTRKKGGNRKQDISETAEKAQTKGVS